MHRIYNLIKLKHIDTKRDIATYLFGVFILALGKDSHKHNPVP